MNKIALMFCFVFITACNPYKKEIPTRSPMKVSNFYVDPTYDHSKLSNVILMPIDSYLDNYDLTEYYEKSFTLSLIKNFGKFSYFNLSFANPEEQSKVPIINLNKGAINRALLGALGEEFQVQGALQVSITDFSPYPPMKIKTKAALFDTNTGKVIWAFDQVFDTDDADVFNALRVWWNTKKAGGDPFDNFTLSVLSPNFFLDYVFYSMAESYKRSRIANVINMTKERKRLAIKE